MPVFENGKVFLNNTKNFLNLCKPTVGNVKSVLLCHEHIISIVTNFHLCGKFVRTTTSNPLFFKVYSIGVNDVPFSNKTTDRNSYFLCFTFTKFENNYKFLSFSIVVSPINNSRLRKFNLISFSSGCIIKYISFRVVFKFNGFGLIIIFKQNTTEGFANGFNHFSNTLTGSILQISFRKFSIVRFAIVMTPDDTSKLFVPLNSVGNGNVVGGIGPSFSDNFFKCFGRTAEFVNKTVDYIDGIFNLVNLFLEMFVSRSSSRSFGINVFLKNLVSLSPCGNFLVKGFPKFFKFIFNITYVNKFICIWPYTTSNLGCIRSNFRVGGFTNGK